MTLGLAPPAGARERRYAGVARGALSALGARGLSVAVALVTVPLTLGHLGPERYGAWMAIASLVAWLAIADIGVGNQLTNALASAAGRRDDESARRAVSTAFVMLGGIALALLAAGLVAGGRVDWSAFLNAPGASGEVRAAVGVAFVAFCLGLPLGLVERVYTALQRGAIANAWIAAAAVATFVGIVVAVRTGGGLATLVAASAGAALGVKALSAVWLFWRDRPDLRPRLAATTRRGTLGFAARGTEFFFIQIGALVLLSTDNIVIARTLGAEQVTPYSIAWQLFMLSNLLQSIAFPYLWAAYAEALAAGERAWAVRTLRLSTGAAAAIAVAVALPLLAFGDSVIRWWAGPAAVPSAATLAWMAAWSVVQAPANAMVCILNAAGRTRWQVGVAIGSAAANLALSIWWARRFGIAGVIAGTVVSYVLIAALPLLAVVTRFVRELGTDPAPAVTEDGAPARSSRDPRMT